MERLKDILYPLEEPYRVRQKPMQVLAVGTSRSGTDSLRNALVELGYDRTYHGYEIALDPRDQKVWYKLYRKKWKGSDLVSTPGAAAISAAEFDQVIGDCVAITDIDAAAFAPELIEAYPEARVILNNRRNVDSWYDSNMKTMVPLIRDWRLWIRSWFCPEHFWLRENFYQGIWRAFYRGDFEHNAKWVLRDHCAMIKGMVPAERLLEWSPEDGWDPLCRFLDKEVPQRSFPNGNLGAHFAKRMEDFYRASNHKADRNMFCVVACIIALGLAAVLTPYETVTGWMQQSLGHIWGLAQVAVYSSMSLIK